MENKKWLNETLAERMERSFRLKIGQTVRIMDYLDGRHKRDVTGKIADIQKHFIVVYLGNYNECFSRVDFFTQKRDKNRQYLVKVGKKEWKQITTEMF